MNEQETGKDKIKKICEILKQESIEPAKLRSEEILSQAKEEAERLIDLAKKKAAEIESTAQKKVQKDREIFQQSLQMAFKQAMETLRQRIEQELFNKQFYQFITSETSDPKIISQMIATLIEVIHIEGTSADLSAIIPEKIPSQKVVAFLGKQLLEQLKEKPMSIGQFAGGAQLRLNERNLVLDLSDEAIYELLEKYLRVGFREVLFQKSS